MRTSRALGPLIVVVMLLTLGAGFAAGVLARRIAVADSRSAGSSEPAANATLAGVTLLDQLQLTTEQRDQMRSIWERVRSDVQGCYQDAQDLQRRRQQALIAMLNDDQKAEFERISNEYAAKFDRLSKKRDKAFAEAVEQTKRLLNDTQRRQYEQILEQRVGDSYKNKSAGEGAPPLDAGL